MLTAMMLTFLQGEQDYERMMAERTAEVQERMRELAWMEGRWEGDAEMEGMPITVVAAAEWEFDGTWLVTRSEMRMGDVVVHADHIRNTWSIERERYEFHYFSTAYASRSVMTIEEDGAMRWEEEEPGPMGRVRGVTRRISDDEFEDLVEIETQPGQWMEMVRTRMHRVDEE